MAARRETSPRFLLPIVGVDSDLEYGEGGGNGAEWEFAEDEGPWELAGYITCLPFADSTPAEAHADPITL